MKRKTRHAFTLIELRVVISILALLVSILLPALNEARSTARRIVCSSHLRSMGTGFHTYTNDSKGMLPPGFFSHGCPAFTYNIYDKTIFKASSIGTDQGPITLLKPFSAAALYDTGIIEEWHSFYCPGTIAFPVGEEEHGPDYYEHPRTGELIIPVRPPEGDSWVRISYTYFKNNIKSMDKMSPFSYMYDMLHDLTMQPHVSSNGVPKGQNVKYGAGHVIFNTNQELFDPDLCGTTNHKTPCYNSTIFFTLLAIEGNNAPDLNSLNGKYSNYQMNEIPHIDGARRGEWNFED